jgi:conjugal transfer mating pair stabilization protein TraN
MQTTQSFCCFPTKMARILHEQGREQLGISWGATEEPSCRGFSLSELQKIDFTQIDLSDVVEDFAIDKEELLNRIRSTIVHLQDAGKIEGESNTKKIAQHEEVLHAP